MRKKTIIVMNELNYIRFFYFSFKIIREIVQNRITNSISIL